MPKFGAVDAELALRASYDQRYGLRRPLGTENRPFASVEMYESERIDRNDLTLTSIKRFAMAKIHETFGLDYITFNNLPSFFVEFCYEIAEAKAKKQDETMNNLSNQVKNAREKKD